MVLCILKKHLVLRFSRFSAQARTGAQSPGERSRNWRTAKCRLKHFGSLPTVENDDVWCHQFHSLSSVWWLNSRWFWSSWRTKVVPVPRADGPNLVITGRDHGPCSSAWWKQKSYEDFWNKVNETDIISTLLQFPPDSITMRRCKEHKQCASTHVFCVSQTANWWAGGFAGQPLIPETRPLGQTSNKHVYYIFCFPFE